MVSWHALDTIGTLVQPPLFETGTHLVDSNPDVLSLPVNLEFPSN